MSGDLGWPEGWPSLNELCATSASVILEPLASALGDAVALFAGHLDGEDATLRLAAVVLGAYEALAADGTDRPAERED